MGVERREKGRKMGRWKGKREEGREKWEEEGKKRGRGKCKREWERGKGKREKGKRGGEKGEEGSEKSTLKKFFKVCTGFRNL